MKTILFCFFIFLSIFCKAQTYPNQNISLLSLIHPNTGPVGVGGDNRRYNGCWGWYQASKNKEYAIVGSSSGTYFIDVSSPASPSVSAFLPGVDSVTIREVKTYQNYCYITCDFGTQPTFQIVDMSTLPATVTVVHNSNTLFASGHTQWIDNDKLYIGGITYAGNTGSSMNIYSLATPTAPVLLRELKQDFPLINYVHDMFVRNDTIYASCATQGLYVFKFNNSTNSFSQLGSYTGYSSGNYNHSSGLTQNGRYLLFCDEIPAGSPIRFVDVQNPGNIQPVQTFQPFATTTPHNPFLIGNKWAVVSCYQEGLYIYDISQPGNVATSGFFDTFPQGGANTGNYGGQDYRGNWGAYPYLPSGIIIAADMQNGVFILDPSDAFNNPVGIKNNSDQKAELILFPNPASSFVSVNFRNNENSVLELKNTLGQTLLEKKYKGPVQENINLNLFENGTYFLSVSSKNNASIKKLVICH